MVRKTKPTPKTAEPEVAEEIEQEATPVPTELDQPEIHLPEWHPPKGLNRSTQQYVNKVLPLCFREETRENKYSDGTSEILYTYYNNLDKLLVCVRTVRNNRYIHTEYYAKDIDTIDTSCKCS